MYTYWTNTNTKIISTWHQNGTNNYVKIYQCKYAFESGYNDFKIYQCKIMHSNWNAPISTETSRHQNVAGMETLRCHYTAERLTTLDNEESHQFDILMTKIGNWKPPVISHYWWWPNQLEKGYFDRFNLMTHLISPMFI